ncbi:hypothetical protein [Streptomyces hirsutus]|uniref:hypothetical protein n=1 Tax=Streptomyces hirsutus TaxID=35620 RepID=UPI00364CFA67
MTGRYIPREDVAELLRAGATYRRVREELGVGSGLIAATRRHYDIPVPKSNAGGRLTPTERPVVVARVEAMLLSGATYEQITKVVKISNPTIMRMRKELGIPPASPMPPSRTVDEALERHLRTAEDGHARWGGPMAGRMPMLCAGGRQMNARRVLFQQHHGRPPVGYVLTVCTEPACIAGAHNADAVMRGTVPAGSSS